MQGEWTVDVCALGCLVQHDSEGEQHPGLCPNDSVFPSF